MSPVQCLAFANTAGLSCVAKLQSYRCILFNNVYAPLFTLLSIIILIITQSPEAVTFVIYHLEGYNP